MKRSIVSILVLGASLGCSSGDDVQPNPGGDSGVDSSVDSTPPDGSPGVDTPPVRDCKTSFSLPLGRSGAKVEIAGEWDAFAAKKPMDDGLGTGTYRVELDLKPGDYGYKFIVDGSYILDPTHAYTRYVGGVENSRVTVDDCKLPLLRVTKSSATADGNIEIDVQYLDGAERKGIAPSSVKATSGSGKSPEVTVDTKTGAIVIKSTGLARDKYTFTLDASDGGGRAAKTLRVPMWIEAEPFQWNDGVLYFVFTDRFRNGDKSNDAPVATIDPRANYQGGDYAGVLAALKEGYFDALGVRSIWLSPPNANSHKPGKGSDGRMYSGYHGYWPVSPREVDSHFGTLADLKALTAEAHKHGIRVLLDLVQNQIHEDHTYVADHKKDGWFNGDGSCVCGGPSCSWDDHPIDCWFTSYLPDVNWTNMGAVDQMIDDAIFWLTEGDADGFRVDAVKHMNAIASTTLRKRIHDTLEGGNARYYLVGETFTGGDDGGRSLIANYVSDRALWGQFDFPLFWSIDSAFASDSGSMGDLDAATIKSETSYGPTALMSPFLGNHDVTRFLSRAAKQIGSSPVDQAWTAPPPAPDSDEPYDRLFLAMTFLLTQRGVPLVYYGDEVGMPGTADPDNRRLMRFGTELSAREKKLFDRVSIVAKARGTLPGLRRGARRTLHTDGDGYVFTRGASKDIAIVALNRGTTSRIVSVAIPPELAVPDGTTLKDLLGGPSVTVSGGRIDVPFTPRGALLFVR